MPDNTPLTSSDAFDAVVIACSCRIGRFREQWVQVGTTPRDLLEPSRIEVHERAIYDANNADRIEILRRINAGTVRAYYYDFEGQPGAVLHPVEDAPHAFWQFHDRHPFWPDDGYKIGNSLTTEGNLVEESDGNRRIEYKGGFKPERPPAVGATIEHSLNEWAVFRANESRIGFRLIIPASLNIQPADLATYADSEAFVDWLDDYRTEGAAIPANFAVEAGAFTGRKWKFPVDPDDLNLRYATFDFAGLNMSRVPGSNQVIVLTILLDIDETDSGYTAASVITDNVAMVVAAASGTIAATGQTVEPPFGSADVTANARKIESNDGSIFMAGGIALAQWKDPGSEVQRIMPLTGFGRSFDYNDLPSRINGGRWAPRPEERPRVDLIYYKGATPTSIWLEPADRFVGYAGTDRLITIDNQSSALLTVGFEKTFGSPVTIMSLRPNELLTVRVNLELNGDAQYSVVNAPFRYLVRGGSFFNVDQPDYRWTTGSVEFGFRPWFPDANRTLRRDADEFSFGSSPENSAGATLTDGLADSHHVITVKHRGDLIFYQQVEAEITGNGMLVNGHSAVLVRERGGAITIIGRFWNPNLDGVGDHRGYTTAFIDECMPGDKYVSGILYPITGTTVSFSNYRVNAISQIIRVHPRIIV